MAKLSKALTWDELADLHDKNHLGRPARTLPVNTVFKWAEDQPDRFKVSKKGTLHKILKKN